eukprot:COSAG05_NODE_3476_length_2036_cov_229.440372_1_plen_273_part_00
MGRRILRKAKQQPVTTTENTQRGQGQLLVGNADSSFTFGASSMQGYRTEMEDRHLCQAVVEGLPGHAFFVVFDGHGGVQAADLAQKQLLAAIVRQAEMHGYAKGTSTDDDAAETLGRAMIQGFIECDKQIRPAITAPSGWWLAGTTVVSCFLTPSHIICANAGDARAVYCKCTTRNADDSDVVALSEDHKPSNPGEVQRIVRAGGSVSPGESGGAVRVEGSLAVSRSLGDFQYKDVNLAPEAQMVSPVPEIKIVSRNPERDELLILACDGKP